MGSRNHEIVPISLICRMTKLRPQTATRQLQALAKNKLVSFEADSKCINLKKQISCVSNASFLDEGVRLTYGGYDFLALKAFSSRDSVLSIGQQIGVGKESDIYLVHGTHHFETNETSTADKEEEEEEEPVDLVDNCARVSPQEYQERVLKIQRLGRTSFRSVKTNRDYHQHRSSCSWLYLSRLAAGLEYRFMKALRGVGLPVPKPLDWSRHCVVMELIRGTLFENVRLRDRHSNNNNNDSDNSDNDNDNDSNEESIDNDSIESFVENKVIDFIEMEHVPILYTQLMELIAELASYGLIHGDFNEFNLLLTRPSPSQVTPIIIDFPQMVSIDHQNAQYYFDRDVECIRTFFSKRFDFTNDIGLFEARWEDIKRNEERKLDVELKASGYIKAKRPAKLRKKKPSKFESESEIDGESEVDSESECSDEVRTDIDTDNDSTDKE